jgi:hypothetical protein
VVVVLLAFCFGVGAGVVIGGAWLLCHYFPPKSEVSARHLVVSNTVIIVVLMALSPSKFLFPASFYDDIYPYYFFVPGPHIFILGYSAAGYCTPKLQTVLSGHTLGYATIILIPGLIGIIVGGAQWYLFGRLYSWWLAAFRKRSF